MEVVLEFPTEDGLGAMLWKKIYAMSYAYRYKLLFKDTPLTWFIIHPSDNAEDKKVYDQLLYNFNNLLYNPWSDIDYKSFHWIVHTGVGLGATAPGMANHCDFLMEAPNFNKIKLENNNKIVIHIRRGNATRKNPRYTEDEFYINILKQIDSVAYKLKIYNPEVIILTDAPDIPGKYTPIKSDYRQYQMWHQPYLEKDKNDEWELTSINWDAIKEAYPSVRIENKLDTYESYLLMLKAKLLIPAHSAFSQSAGLLTHNSVLSLPPKQGMDPQMNKFKNCIGTISSVGEITLNPIYIKNK